MTTVLLRVFVSMTFFINSEMNSFVLKAIGMSPADCEILALKLRFTLHTVSVYTVCS